MELNNKDIIIYQNSSDALNVLLWFIDWLSYVFYICILIYIFYRIYKIKKVKDRKRLFNTLFFESIVAIISTILAVILVKFIVSQILL